jgi:hypothetical protein
MARMPQALVDRIKRYAVAHRQPISVVVRDALLLLMEEYPSRADLSPPHPLAAHDFRSDRYESPLDTLLGETDSAELDEVLSDTNEEAIASLMLGVNRRPDIVSDTKPDDTPILYDKKEAQPDIVSDRNMDTHTTRAMTPPRAPSAKVSDKKGATAAILSDAKGDGCPPAIQENQAGILSDRKADRPEGTPVPAILSDSNVPAFDTTKYVLGKLCPREHDFYGTGHALRHLRRHVCLACDAEQARARRKAQRKA